MSTSKILAMACALVIAGTGPSVDAQPTVYIVRHAEKVATWPGGILDAYHPLSIEGVARAESLATIFDVGSIAGIYSSRTTRTVHTALPLSQKLGLPIMEATACQDTSLILDFYGEIIRNYKSDQSVLLISHSDIIPHLMLKAGLPLDCWPEQGISGRPGQELLISGYTGIWRIDLSKSMNGECTGFTRREFWSIPSKSDAGLR
ncbi:MAG: histidine phosphatase family protein [Candidatus Latescibacteria bacterium]|jgi:phosphohistidine phosphatase SixA|nr:histidine phosphatase family protein [Candidatus Latescibacterota bacterium]